MKVERTERASISEEGLASYLYVPYVTIFFRSKMERKAERSSANDAKLH